MLVEINTDTVASVGSKVPCTPYVNLDDIKDSITSEKCPLRPVRATQKEFRLSSLLQSF
jgi:hypothetical protein